MIALTLPQLYGVTGSEFSLEFFRSQIRIIVLNFLASPEFISDATNSNSPKALALTLSPT